MESPFTGNKEGFNQDKTQKDSKDTPLLTRSNGETYFALEAVKKLCWQTTPRQEQEKESGHKDTNLEHQAFAALAKPLYMIAAADSRCPVIVEGKMNEGGRLETIFSNEKQNIGTLDRVAGMYALVRKVAYENLDPRSVIVTIKTPLADPPPPPKKTSPTQTTNTP